jgi:tRNA(fMet)-specific endonuclease VapC
METNRVLIETTLIIEYLRTRHRAIITRFEKAIAKFDECFLSVITVYEVEFGAARAGRISDLTGVLPYVDVLPIDETVAEQAAKIHANLVALNQEIGVKDIFIAATAIVNELPILTYNIEHFQRVPGLQVVSPSEL